MRPDRTTPSSPPDLRAWLAPAVLMALLLLAISVPVEAQTASDSTTVRLTVDVTNSPQPPLDGWDLRVVWASDSTATPSGGMEVNVPADTEVWETRIPRATCPTYWQGSERPAGPWRNPRDWRESGWHVAECPEILPTWESTWEEVTSEQVVASIEITSMDPGPSYVATIEPDSVLWYDVNWADTLVVNDTLWGVHYVDEDGAEWDMLAPDTVLPQPAADSILALIDEDGVEIDYPRGGLSAHAQRYRVVAVHDAASEEAVPVGDMDPEWVERWESSPWASAGGQASAVTLSLRLAMASVAEPEWPYEGAVGRLTVTHWVSGRAVPAGSEVELWSAPDSPDDEGWGVCVREGELAGSLVRVPYVVIREAPGDAVETACGEGVPATAREA